MLDINHHMSHHSDNNMLSDCVRIDDASSHSKLFRNYFIKKIYKKIILLMSQIYHTFVIEWVLYEVFLFISSKCYYIQKHIGN